MYQLKAHSNSSYNIELADFDIEKLLCVFINFITGLYYY